MSCGVVRPYGQAQGVTHAVEGRFVRYWRSSTLVVIKANLVEHYALTSESKLLLLHQAELDDRVRSASVVTVAGSVKDTGQPSGLIERSRKRTISTQVNVQSAPNSGATMRTGFSEGASDSSLGIFLAQASDRLLLGFSNMRVSLLRWDHTLFDWVTEQIFQMEHYLFQTELTPSFADVADDLMTSRRLPLSRGRLASDDHAFVEIDPRGRGIVIYGKKTSKAYFAPVHHVYEDRMGDTGRPTDVIREAEIFCLDFMANERKIQRVRSVVFLEGYFEPTVAVLYETAFSWAGRASKSADTCALMILSVDLSARTCAVVWHFRGLPYDAEAIVGVPESAGGGVLVLSPHILIYLRHGRCVCGLSLNSYGDRFVDEYGRSSSLESIVKYPDPMEIQRARCSFLKVEQEKTGSRNTALLALRSGQLYFLRIPSSNVVGEMALQRAGSTSIASLILPLTTDLVFLGSWVSDSVLVRYTLVVAHPEDNPGTDSADVESRDMIDKSESAEAEESWLFKSRQNEGGSVEDVPDLQRKWRLEILDSLPCMGPASDFAIGRQNSDGGNQNKMEMVIAAGASKNGCLGILRQSVRLEVLSSFSIPACKRAFTAIDIKFNKDEVNAMELRIAHAEAQNEEIRGRNELVKQAKMTWIQEEFSRRRVSRPDGEPEPDWEFLGHEIEREASILHPLEPEIPVEDRVPDSKGLHSYLFLSTDRRTTVLVTSNELSEISTGDFAFDSPTFAAGNLLNNRIIAQVAKDGVRLLVGQKRVSEFPLPYSSPIKEAQISDPFVLILLHDGTLLVLRANSSDDSGCEETDDMERPYEEFDAGTMEDFGLGNSSNAEVQLTVEIEVLVELKPTEERIVATAQIHRGRLGRLAIQLDASEQHRLHLALERRKVGSGYWDDMDDIERMLYADAGMSITSSMGGKALVQDREVEAVMDDEEMMLYSESKAREEHKDLDKTGNHVSMPEKHVNHVIAIAYTDSCFELRSLPIFSEILFATTDLHLGLRTLYPTGNIDLPSTSFGNRTSSSKIAHMHLCQLNNASALDGELPASLCLVLVTSDGRLLLYRTALQMEFNREGKPYFAISLHRIILQIVPELCHDEESISSVKEWGLIPFYDLGGRSGLLMNVPNPLIITLDRGYPRVHAFSIENEDKAILWMVPFHNVNCHKGAIAILPGGGVCVCSLPSNNQISLETSWVQRKVNARANVRKIAYHSSSESYVALASSEEEISSADMRRRILALSSAKNATAEARVELDEERLPLEIIEKHEIRLYQPGSWSLVKTYSLGENEAGLAVASMALDVYKQPKQADQDEEQQKRQQQDGGEMAVSPFAVTERLKSKHLVVVGTGYLKGEDANIRGRLLVFEISRQEGFSGLGQFSRFQLQLIAEKELKGPVSSLSTVQGYIACGVGPKVELHKLVEDEIVCTCFFFADLYTSSLSTLKQYILVGDMMKSVSLVYWRERNKSMTLLGKDFETARVYSTDFLIDGDELSLIFSDSEGNIHMINYGGISDPDARGGERLVPRGSYSLGARIGNFRRVGLTEKGDNHVTLFVTLDGAIGGIVPVPPRDFKKIRALQGKLVNLDELPRYAGINPGRMHDLVSEPFGNGTYRPSGQHLTNGRLLGEFRFLTEARQIEITRQVGLSPSSVSRQLQYLDQILSRF